MKVENERRKLLEEAEEKLDLESLEIFESLNYWEDKFEFMKN